MQTEVDKGRGDCQRAAVASMFELEISQVPHFKLFGDNWFKVFYHFLQSIGYDFQGTANKDKPITDDDLINGCVIAGVPSRTHKDTTHAVLVDKTGLVIHDPNPNKQWQDVNVIESGDIINWNFIGKEM